MAVRSNKSQFEIVLYLTEFATVMWIRIVCLQLSFYLESASAPWCGNLVGNKRKVKVHFSLVVQAAQQAAG